MMTFQFVPDLPMTTLPEGGDYGNRFYPESYTDYEVTRMGNVVDGSQIVTMYKVSKDDHTIYVLSDFYDGSYWYVEEVK